MSVRSRDDAQIRQNLFFSFQFNGIGGSVAAGVLDPVAGILLSPMLAGAAMALSSFTVVLNALRLNGEAMNGGIAVSPRTFCLCRISLQQGANYR